MFTVKLWYLVLSEIYMLNPARALTQVPLIPV